MTDITYLLFSQTLTLHIKVKIGTYTYLQSFLQFNICMYMHTTIVSCTSSYSPQAYYCAIVFACHYIINHRMSGVQDQYTACHVTTEPTFTLATSTNYRFCCWREKSIYAFAYMHMVKQKNKIECRVQSCNVQQLRLYLLIPPQIVVLETDIFSCMFPIQLYSVAGQSIYIYRLYNFMTRQYI